MALKLDGRPVPGYDLRVKAIGRLARQDQSGETSGTGASHKGWKAWALGVSVKVRFGDGEDLTALRRLFEARTDEEGAFELDQAVGSPGVPRLYKVGGGLADALGVTWARFSDHFQVDEDERLRIWHVKFTMIEERSIPERTAERTEPGKVAVIEPTRGTTDTAERPAQSLAPEGWTAVVLNLTEKLAHKFIHIVKGS